MTRLFNDPADFADEMVDGFVAANASRVRKVPGGVARSTTSPEGTVALVVGGLSIPVALFMNSPAATVAVIAVTACAIFAALPNFWTVPTQFLTGAAAAAGVALINTVGNLGGFAAPYITGAVSEWTGGYQVPMFIVGFFMVLSSVLMFVRGRRTKRNDAAAPSIADEQTAVANEAGA